MIQCRSQFTRLRLRGVKVGFLLAFAFFSKICLADPSMPYPAPVAVRYAWGVSPECNLYN